MCVATQYFVLVARVEPPALEARARLVPCPRDVPVSFHSIVGAGARAQSCCMLLVGMLRARDRVCGPRDKLCLDRRTVASESANWKRKASHSIREASRYTHNATGSSRHTLTYY
eukprot:6338235-Prymnesium_polylepis.2